MKKGLDFILLIALVFGLLSQPYTSSSKAAATSDIGFRTEDPGPFLLWPLPHVALTNISRLPDSIWTHNFLGITDCPSYPALIDAAYWPNSFAGNYNGNRNMILAGVPDERVKWQNQDNAGAFNNAFACYSSLGSSLPDHAGTDISAYNGTDVLAAASADEVYVTTDKVGDYRIRLRHPNVNGSGQTWYTFYVHLQSSEYGLGVHQTNIPAGHTIGEVGNGHLHFQAAIGPNYSNSEARNIWGIDQFPWTGCLWSDQTLCPTPQSNLATDDMDNPSPGHFSDVPIDAFAFPFIETLYHIGAVAGFSDGTYRLNYATSRAAGARIIIGGLERRPNYTDNESAFSDVPPSHQFYQYIRDLKELEISQGFSDGTFRPDDALTRCGAAVFIVKARGDNPNYTDGRRAFSDVPPSHSCYQFIQHLYELGVSNGYSDGTFRPDNTITRGDMAIFAVRGLPGLIDKKPSFHDVLHDHPFFTHIEAIYSRGITGGCSSTSPYPIFCPDDNFTRGQAAVYISRSLGFEPYYTDGRRSFSDVPTNHTFYHYIEHIKELGIVVGYSDGTFKPDQPINRRDIAIMITRGLNVLGISCPQNHTSSFTDVPPGSQGYEFIQCLKDFGISSGYSDGSYRPNDYISRGGGAKFVNVAFFQIAQDIEQEPEETINDDFDTAPVIDLLDENIEEEDAIPGEAPILILPDTSEDDDIDIVAVDLTVGQEYELVPIEIGPNLLLDIDLYMQSNNQIQLLPFANNQPIMPITNSTLQSVSTTSTWWTVPQTGRYYLVYDNVESGASEGVNLRIGVRERILSTIIYLPLVWNR